MNPSDVDTVWAAVEAPIGTGALAGKAAPGVSAVLGVLLAIDEIGLRHLLIPVAESAEVPRGAMTKGLEATIDELRVGRRSPRRYLDVACRDATLHGTFTVVVAEILSEVAPDLSDGQEVLERVLARWRWFLDMPGTGLTDTEAVGLFGELWFLEFWMAPIDHAVLTAWTGPMRDRHDFKSNSASVEVKSTRARSDGSATHRITSLDQLEDPEQGQLYLFSLRLIPDPIGSHSLDASVDRIRNVLTDSPDLLHRFDDRLRDIGYAAAGRARYDTSYRVVAEELYRLGPGFPRLTSVSFIDGAVPDGVDNIGYNLDLAACGPWRIATAPGPESAVLRGLLRNG